MAIFCHCLTWSGGLHDRGALVADNYFAFQIGDQVGGRLPAASKISGPFQCHADLARETTAPPTLVVVQ